MENYCMPDGIDTREKHLQYLKDIGVINSNGVVIKNHDSFIEYIDLLIEDGYYNEALLENIEACLSNGGVDSIVDSIIVNFTMSESKYVLEILLKYILTRIKG